MRWLGFTCYTRLARRCTIPQCWTLTSIFRLRSAARTLLGTTWSAQTATPRDGMAGLAGLWLTSLPAVTALMGGRRDIVVITHGSVGAASEVRALAQCATAALHLRHGMREGARVWLTL
jgi:hypothetical protein